MQRTLTSSVSFEGTGLHSGQKIRLTVHPASAHSGIWFRRTDQDDDCSMIPARWDAVSDTRLNTRISNEHGVSVSTIEHLMAALAGCGISNALVDVDGPEVPLLDGSSAQFVRAILTRGIVKQSEHARVLRIRRPVSVTHGDARATLLPANEFRIDFHIDFDDAAIGQQTKSMNMANGAFVRELCDSRTFCRKGDIDRMRADGLIAGASLSSAIVVDEGHVMTPGGLRHSDEPVRHKMLDALGDLMLAGAPILGRYVGHRAGHAMTNKLLHALFADPDNYTFVACDEALSARLPGSDICRADHVLIAA